MMNLYESITHDQEMLAIKILNDMYPQSSFKDVKRKEKAIQDIKWTLKYLLEGLKSNNTQITKNLFIWYQKLFIGLGIDIKHAQLLFESTQKILNETYHSKEINDYFSHISFDDSNEQNILLKNNPYTKEQKQYLNALLNSNRIEAQNIIQMMIEKNTPIEDIYLFVFQETMREVGDKWHKGEINVGHEHYATAVTQYIMGSLYPQIFKHKKKAHKLLASAVGSEMHELGIRMVADIFELKGWDTDYLGANLPEEYLISYAISHKPDVIALSITMPYHIGKLRDTIKHIREEEKLKNTKIIVGGLPFLDNEDLVNSVNADAFARNALEGVRIANQLLQ